MRDNMRARDADKVLIVNVLWDDDAGVWSASSTDVKGLAIEAATKEILIKRLKTVIPELLELNHAPPNRTDSEQPIVPVELVISGRQNFGLTC